MNLLRSFVLSSFSALLLALSFPGFGLHFLVWFALLPLIHTMRSRGLIGSTLSSLWTGLLFYYFHLSWFTQIGGVNPVTSFLANLANAWIFVPFGLVISVLNRRFAQWNLITIPTVWVLLEYLHNHQGFLSLSWGTLGYSQYTVPWVASVSKVAGVFGVSFVIVTANTVIYEVARSAYEMRRDRKTFTVILSGSNGLAAAGIALCLALLVGGGQVQRFKESEKGADGVKVAVVQGGVPGERTGEERERVLRRYIHLTGEAARSKPRLIVWPETAVPASIPYSGTLVNLLNDISSETGAYLLVGAAGYDKFGGGQSGRSSSEIANSAFLFDPSGKNPQRYDKMLLLPFAEYLPLRGRYQWPAWIVGSGWKDSRAGREMKTFQMGDLRFGVQICWENLFPDLFRKVSRLDVDFMVSLNSESFTPSKAARQQMLAINTFRAIENGVPVVRSTTTGISAVIRPSGDSGARVMDRDGKEVDVEGYLVTALQPFRTRTFYNRYGDWFIIFLLFMLLVILGLSTVGKTGRGRTAVSSENSHI